MLGVKRGNSFPGKRRDPVKTSPFVFALATMICWGIAPIFGKAAMLRIDPWVGLAMRSFIITLIMLIWVIVTGHIHSTVPNRIFNLGADLLGGDFSLFLRPSRLFLRH